MLSITKNLWRSRRTQLLLLALAAAVIAASAGAIESAVLSISQNYANWLTQWTGNHGWAVLGLPVLALGGIKLLLGSLLMIGLDGNLVIN